MTKTDSADRFIQAYNELDNYMRKTLKMGDEADHSYLIAQMSQKGYRIFEIHGFELRQFARLRNAIVHSPFQNNSQPIAQPNPDIVEKYETIKNLVIHPPKALAIAIPAPKIFTASFDSNIQQIMKIMIDKSYTHIPILENGVMIGVFSENTLFSYLAASKDILITADATMRDFKEFIPFEKHQNEYFEFISKEAMLDEVEEIFKKGLQDLKRIAVVYITEHGKKEERLLGMLTAWDIAGSKKDF